MESDSLFPGTPYCKQIAINFVNRYYQILRENPWSVIQFYRVSSIITRAEVELSGTVASEISIYDLENKLKATDYGGSHVDIFTVDSQSSLMGAILVNVTGSISWGYNRRRNFMQTFLLVPQEVDYYVKNDFFRYLDQKDSDMMSLDLVAEDVSVAINVNETLKSVDNATSMLGVKVEVEEIVGMEQAVSLLISTPSVEDGLHENFPLVVAGQVEAGQKMVPALSKPEMEPAAEEMIQTSRKTIGSAQSERVTFATEVDIAKKEIMSFDGQEGEGSTSDVEPAEIQEAEDVLESGSILENSVIAEQLDPLLVPVPSAEQKLEVVPKIFDHTFSYASVVRMKKVATSTFPSTQPVPRSDTTGPRQHYKVSDSYLPRVTTASQGLLQKSNGIASEPVDDRTVYVRNLPVTTSASELELELRRFGLITAGGVTLKGQKDATCYAFAEFKHSASAKTAIDASPISFAGRPVYIYKKKAASGTKSVRADHGPGRRDL